MLRYSHLASVTLGVTDLERARAFYARLPGVRAEPAHAGGARLRVGAEGAALDLVASDRPGLRRFGFQMESAAAVEEVRSILLREGLACSGDGRTVRTVEPHTGAQVEFLPPQSTGDGAPGCGEIEGFGHVVLRTPAYREAVAFWRERLGFRLSDEIEGRISLLRCFPNPQHHSLGIARGERRMFHHLNFRLRDGTDLDAIARDFARAGVRIASGPGVHGPSGNRFLYFYDPDGLTLELATLNERFVEGRERAPRVLPDRPESFAMDGVARDAAMYTVGELDALE